MWCHTYGVQVHRHLSQLHAHCLDTAIDRITEAVSWSVTICTLWHTHTLVPRTLSVCV